MIISDQTRLTIRDENLKRVQILIFILFLIACYLIILDFGLSSFILGIVSVTFFVYLRIQIAVVFYFVSLIVLILSWKLSVGLVSEILPYLFVVVPVIIISIFLSNRNFRFRIHNIESSIQNQKLTAQLEESKQKLESEVKSRTQECHKIYLFRKSLHCVLHCQNCSAKVSLCAV